MNSNPGPLGRATLFRFVHAFDSGGGMERLIEDVDQALLARNSMTVVRMHLGRNLSKPQRTEREVGRGRLICIAVPCTPGLESNYADEPIHRIDWRMQLRRHLLHQPLLWRWALGPWVRRRRLAARPGEMIEAGHTFKELSREFNFTLCVMHFFGSADAEEVISEARSRGIPIALSNHFANDRFLHLAIRKHVLSAARVGGVNGLQVPSYLRRDFVNLADGIDLNFFHPRYARPLTNQPNAPLLFLPARVLRAKGHWDVVQCTRKLHDQGMKVAAVFAGRADSVNFLPELRREITRLELNDSVHFLGPQHPEQLRDWYYASTVTLFPTYHHEGLGRITVESQAMGTPPVAYGTGGVAEGIRDGETGFVVRTGDLSALTARVAQIVRDAALRKRLAQAGRLYVEERYDLSAFAARHESFYLSCLKAGAS